MNIQTGTLVSPIYCFSSTQKQIIEQTLKLDEKQVDRLNYQKIYITPFSNNLEIALTMLKGMMVDKDLLVTNERVKVVLGELSLEIDQKSEIIVTNDSDIKRKEINGDYLKKVFTTVQQKELFDEVLNNLSINTIMKKKVKRAKLSIPLIYQTLKEQLKQKADFNLILSKSNDEDAIKYLREVLNDMKLEINADLAIALAIECFCELGETNI
ncbi:hypothetical protein [Enterococcus gilvus]|uniref:hypothetical protein n=1 Tax=Enterococcus gilvus TaxID=160453 RepID=UPI002910B2D3|nr:hypothetical protein [Enterococcus gilvus]MDU5510875.1 hypothetical protein [Enterococcus gilvus]